MEDVRKAAIAAPSPATQRLTRPQPREVSHSKRTELGECHWTPAVHSSSYGPLRQPLLGRPESEATLIRRSYGAHVYEHHVGVKIHVTPIDEKGNVCISSIPRKGLQVLSTDNRVGEGDETRLADKSKTSKFPIR